MTKPELKYSTDELEQAKDRYVELMKSSKPIQGLAQGLLAARKLHLAFRFLLRRELEATGEPRPVEDMIDDASGQIAMKKQSSVEDLLSELTSYTLPFLAQKAADEKNRSSSMAADILNKANDAISQDLFKLRIPFPCRDDVGQESGILFFGEEDTVNSLMHEMHRMHRIPDVSEGQPSVLRIVSPAYAHLTALNKKGGFEWCATDKNWQGKTHAKTIQRLESYAKNLVNGHANVLIIDDLYAFDPDPTVDSLAPVVRWASKAKTSVLVGVPDAERYGPFGPFAHCRDKFTHIKVELDSGQLIYEIDEDDRYTVDWGVLQDNATEKTQETSNERPED